MVPPHLPRMQVGGVDPLRKKFRADGGGLPQTPLAQCRASPRRLPDFTNYRNYSHAGLVIDDIAFHRIYVHIPAAVIFKTIG
ncbi:MAG: hypothetical protein A4E34_00162 [Methanoregula sp. PtaU1.Bin006]|nr:MAG: hypothetical protein A4E33_02925 [Methanoregula sp. PtaB.Bin085]OPY36763.1 MAG: hypothetical protein A4E34_00162 [Methanoregula sp. PtaU1.Bin006]